MLLVERGQVLIPVGARHGHHRANLLDLARHAPTAVFDAQSNLKSVQCRVDRAHPTQVERAPGVIAQIQVGGVPEGVGESRRYQGHVGRGAKNGRVVGVIAGTEIDHARVGVARVAAHQRHDRARRIAVIAGAGRNEVIVSSGVAVRIPPRALERPARKGSRRRRRGEEAVPVGALDQVERHAAQRQIRRSGHQLGGRGRGQRARRFEFRDCGTSNRTLAPLQVRRASALGTARCTTGMRARSSSTLTARPGRSRIREPRLSDHCTGTTAIE